MTELAARQNVNDLEEVLRGDAQCADKTVLNRARHLAKTSFVVLAFEHMKFNEGHVWSPLLLVTVSSIRLRIQRYRPRSGSRPPPRIGRPRSDDHLGRRNGSQRSSGGSAAPLHPANPVQSHEWPRTPGENHGCREDSGKLL